ncbi:HicB family protein [Bacteriovorax sp. BAL6_X]|uniref:toxin-antitoxin system HicB family antitoxin n=1 Tax=Bacteriovorax sp. BAL6_X TaxID=1201290 RepID=UPI0003866341|nr:toxin-antitoxin system HicB family antitoxin [Bacteriovorax sp. BAL6_X]EPZ52084.1 HicB family protein [Bacteriovorax sp. BAL6_X]
MAKFKPKKESSEDVAVTLRLPKELHSVLKAYAENEELSLNKMIVQMIEHCLEEANQL